MIPNQKLNNDPKTKREMYCSVIIIVIINNHTIDYSQTSKIISFSQSNATFAYQQKKFFSAIKKKNNGTRGDPARVNSKSCHFKH